MSAYLYKSGSEFFLMNCQYSHLKSDVHFLTRYRFYSQNIIEKSKLNPRASRNINFTWILRPHV